MRRDPFALLHSPSGHLTRHLIIHLGQVQHVPNAVVSVLHIHRPLQEEVPFSTLKHLVELLLILVDAVTGLVPAIDLVESEGAYVAALGNGLLCQLNFLFLRTNYRTVDLELHFQRFDCTGIEYVEDASVKAFVKH